MTSDQILNNGVNISKTDFLCNHDCGNCRSKIPKKISEFQYQRSLSAPYNGIISLTNRCNLSCPYCFVNQADEDMTLETARKAMQYLLNNYRDMDPIKPGRPTVGLFGGEPMLMFEEIIVPLLEEYGDKIAFSITTNGTLLTEDNIMFLRDHDCDILLSMDGTKAIQDAQRPMKSGESSFDKLYEIIPFLLLYFPHTVCRATITKASIPHFAEIFDFVERLGFRQFAYAINAFEQYTPEDYEILQHQMDKVALKFVRRIKNNEPIGIRPTGILQAYDHIFNHNHGSVLNNTMKRCGYGTVSIGISPSGEIIPCQENNSDISTSIGNIYDGIDTQKHQQFLEEQYALMENITCEMDYGCSPKQFFFCLEIICPKRLDDLKKDNQFAIPSGQCILNRAHFHTATRLYLNLHNKMFPLISAMFSAEGKVC
jgi:uncharacterized protein